MDRYFLTLVARRDGSSVFETGNKYATFPSIGAAVAGSRFGDLCKQNDMSFIHECFADRRYEPDGRLRNRKYNNAVLHEDEELMNQVKNILNGYVVTSRDSKLELKADSICLHSDTSSAVKKAALIHDYLKSHHVGIHPQS